MRSKTVLTVLHRLAILAYVVFALFPLFWLLKVSVTPNDLLYSEGVRMWPSRTTFEQDIWLSSREFLDPIDVLQVAREGTTLSATVNVHVAETEPGRPVPACIRPVNLRLHIEGLPPGDYTLQLRRAES